MTHADNSVTIIEHNSVMDYTPAHNNPPLGANEMKTFFDRLSTNFFELSEQAGQLKATMVQVERLTEAVKNLEADNINLRNQVLSLTEELERTKVEVKEAYDLSASYARERDELKLKVEQQAIEIHHYEETTRQQVESIGRLQDEVELVNSQLFQSIADYKIVREERDTHAASVNALRDQVSRQANTIHLQVEAMGQLQTKLSEANDELSHFTRQRDEWKSREEQLQTAIDRLKESRDHFVSIIDVVREAVG